MRRLREWAPSSWREFPLGFLVTLLGAAVGLILLLPEQRWPLEHTESFVFGLANIFAWLVLLAAVHAMAHFSTGWLQVQITGMRAEYIWPWCRSRASRFGGGLGVASVARNGHGPVVMLPAWAGLLAVIATVACIVVVGHAGTGVFEYDAIVWFGHFAAFTYSPWMLFEYLLMDRNMASLQWRRLGPS